MTALRISKDLSLPLDAVTQTYAFIARKGAGKTYGATKLAEEMLGAHAQVVAMDPVGNWHGLRLAADGKSPGIPIYVFGGEHGDVPLVPEAGARIAELVIEKHVSVVLDVSAFRKAERKRFAADFAEEFFHRKKAQRSPVHLFLEEAQKLVPQNPEGDERRMLGAFEDIVRLGRNYGIGATLVSQRPQSVNKEVLSQVECLVVGQVNGTHERKALDEWVREHELDRGLVGELPSLEVGEVFVWSPSWLRTFKRTRIAPKWTYDASATPKVGQKIVRPGELSPVDVEALKADMAEVVSKAAAEDPKALRRRIAELEKQLRERVPAAAPAETKVERVEVPVVKDAQIKRVEELVAKMEKVGARIVDELAQRQQAVVTEAGNLRAALVKAQRPGAPAEWGQRFERLAQPARTPVPASGNGHAPPALGDWKPGRCERSILTALAQYPDGRTKVQVAVLTGYAVSGGGFQNALSALRSRGLIEDAGPGLRITSAGLAVLGPYDPLPTGRELLEHWMRQLGKAERESLRVLAEAHPATLTKEQVAERAGYVADGGGFQNALGRLRTLELVTGKGELRASDTLFGS